MRFVLQEKIGEGAVGQVYRALDSETGDIVALKILPAKKASREELRLARRITHRNICRVYDHHTEADRFFISMELVEGETLRNYLDRVGRLAVDEALRLAEQIMDGLEEAHRLRILHRDLKPENIMALPDGTVKIMDFGVAHYIDPAGTLGSRLLGTPTHMAPEQITGQPASAATDIYSLGLILYEMINGRPAFDGASAGELVKKQLLDSPRPMAPSIDLPPHVAKTILRCLEKEPGRRFASVAELRNALVYGGAKNDVPSTSLHRLLIAVTATIITIVAIVGIAFRGVPSRQNATEARSVTTTLTPEPLLPRGLDVALQSIAIFPFKNLQSDPRYQSFERSIVESVTAAFSRSGRFRVVERSRLDELIGALKVESPQKAGTLVGAQYLMFGSFQVFIGEIRIYAQILTTEKGEAVFTDTISGDVAHAPVVADTFAQQMITHLKELKK